MPTVTNPPPSTSETSRPDRVRFGGIHFDNVDMPGAIAAIDELVVAGGAAQVVTPNVDHVIRMGHDPDYAKVVADAALILADGQPIVWATKLLGRPLKTRVAGSDLFPLLCGHAAERGHRVFFLGGAPGAAEQAKQVLTERYPKLQVVGIECPPYGFEKDEAELARLTAAVRAAEADILFVGLGSPKQEHWLHRYLADTTVPVGIGIGVSFSFVAGSVKRAPRWMQRLGLEWFFRLTQEPMHLAHRYLVRGWAFVPILVREWWRGSAAEQEERA